MGADGVQCGVCEIFWLTDWCVRTCGGVLVLHCSLWGLQKDINTFSRLNNQYHELKDELNTQKEDLVNLQDAQNEVMMQMDDTEPVKMAIGEVYCDQTQDDAMDILNAKVEEAEGDVSKKEAKMAEVKAEMAVLKGRLTAKFGKNINLEEEPE
mmetsp:Transcript_21756/g.52959  ORF Transcript_21756/g.52959 Transcript_21756/m.52959 type:complete len:153 (-) Transcript_21756:90-548(-)